MGSGTSKRIEPANTSKGGTNNDIVAKGPPIRTFEHTGEVWSIAYAPDGTTLAAGGEDNKVTVYDIVAKGPPIRTFEHTGEVWSIAYAPDGTTLAAGGDDKKVTVYCPMFTSPDEFSMEAIIAFLKSSSSRYAQFLYRVGKSGTTCVHRWMEKGVASDFDGIKTPIRLVKNKDGQTPLDTGINQGSHDKCFKLVQNCLLPSIAPTADYFAVLVDALPRLLEEGYHDIVELIFENALFPTKTNEKERLQLPQNASLFARYAGSNLYAYDPRRQLFLENTAKQTSQKRVEVQTYAVGLPGLLSNKKALIALLEKASLKTFETKAMQLIVEYLWNELWKHYMFQAIAYILMCILFTGGHFFNLFDPGSYWTKFGSPFLLAAAGFTVIFSLYEIRHMCRRGVRKHFSSGWNRYEVLCYLSVLTSIVFATMVWPYEKCYHAASTVLVWIGILGRVRGFKSFSVLITTFTQILWDIRNFMVILLIIIFAFSMAFKFLFPGVGVFENFHAFQTVYNMMYGLVEVEFLEGEAGDQIVGTMAVLLFVTFTFIVVLVLMNMLIALMGDSFNNVMENIRVQSVRGKAQVCADLLIDLNESNRIFGQRWLHACVLKDEGSSVSLDDWEGQSKTLQNKIVEEVKKKVGEMVGAKMDGVEAKMDASNAKMDKKLDASNAKMDASNAMMEAKMDKILKLLQKS